jgi:hypothetical protein
MKPRHAAALALVGWYLMVPPLDRKGDIDQDAAISKWRVVASADTIAGCKRAKADLEAELKRYRPTQAERDNPNSNDPAVLQALREELMQRITLYLELESTAACIATDDPRLKEK